MIRRICRTVFLFLYLYGVSFLVPNFSMANDERIIMLETGESKILYPGVVDKVAVGDPKVADVKVLSKKEILVVAKSEGGTNLYIWTGKTSSSYQLIVFPRNVKPLADEITKTIGIQGVTSSIIGNSVAVTGEVSTQEQKDRSLSIASRYGRNVIDLLKVTPKQKQVQIKVKMIETSKDAIKELGVNWKDETGGSGIANLIKAATTQNPLGIISDRVKMWVDEGRAKLLAEPNLITVTGTSASFLAGGEIPVPVMTNGQTSIEWKTYGVSLTVTPRQDANGDLMVKVRPEVSTLDWSSATGASTNLPAMKKRWADTELRVVAGSSIVIAGLLQNEETKVESRLPVLGSLPIIGNLFKSTRYVNKETELLVVLTPSIYEAGQG